jgi:ribosomal protein L11 methyltransferase
MSEQSPPLAPAAPADRFWHEVVFQVSGQQLPAAENVLQSLGALSISLYDAGDQPLLEPAPGELPTWDRIIVKALFEQHCDPAELPRQLRQHLPGVGEFSLNKIENRLWERAWLDDFKPMAFGRRLWIYPSHITPPDSGTVNVTLDPGLAFGTGTHPTTALCLHWLDGRDLENKTIVDYGCGSGVLAVAALKLGAQLAVGTDRDPQALTASRWNAEQNRVTDRLQLYSPETLPADLRADIVLANILSDILIELKPTLTALVRPRGQLVLSGILSRQADSVLQAYGDSFDFTEPVLQEDWTLLAGVRKTFVTANERK